MTKSNCCNAELHTVTSDEGTAYYMCAKCKNPSDTGKGLAMSKTPLQIAREIVSRYVPDKGCDNCLGDLHQGCTDECKANWKLSNEVADLLTTAKAEGYQEGVKAMGEAMKSRYYNPPNASEAVKYVTKNVHSNVDLIANQLLNSQGEERE